MEQNSDDKLYIYIKKKEDFNNKHKVYLAGGVIFSLILILMAINIATQRLSYFGRASAPGGVSIGNADLSLENSYVFASPLSAASDGVSIIRVTVFLLNNQGLGVAGKNVNLKITGNLNVASIQPTSDNMGRAIFDLTSNTPGSYTVSAEIEGALLPQTVSISFR
jgi:hypothetical protein